jgi:hypothetical protein
LACENAKSGHEQVLEAISTLRLRFGEPIRFKFLIGMLNSFGSPDFQVRTAVPILLSPSSCLLDVFLLFSF